MPNYDDSSKPSDATVLRPRPGAGKRAGTPASNPAMAPISIPRPAARQPEPSPLPTAPAAGQGLNPLVQAATPLLLLAGHIRSTLQAPDLQALRHHAVDEIRRFEERAAGLGVNQQVVLAARYVLCAGLDEAVLSTPWGAHSEWAQQTLLVVLHREAWGGEKFFEMLERISQDPARHIDLMELQYLCVAFGFAGKYQVLERGHARLGEVQQTLYRRIREQRPIPPPELSPRWQGVQDTRNRLIKYVPGWVVAAAAVAIVALTFAIYYTRLDVVSTPVYAALSNIGRDAFVGTPPPVAPVAGPTLKQLLAPQEQSGQLTVQEQGGRTTVTIVAANLFNSGSATPNPEYEPVLQAIADAIRQVPGRVLIEGHTDDQRLRSLRYANNFELSLERARTVMRSLQAGNDPARFEAVGMGSTVPIDPADRARNRRVEIIHIPG